MVHGDDLRRLRLGYDDAVVFLQPLVVKNSGVLQELSVRLEILLADERIGKVFIPPTGWRAVIMGAIALGWK